MYFSAEIALLMGERDLGIDEAEAWLQSSTTPLLHAGGTCVYRSSLESAVALARARLAVLRSLEQRPRPRRSPPPSVIDPEDAWATETGRRPESVFAERWQAFLGGSCASAGGGGVPAIPCTPPGFAGELPALPGAGGVVARVPRGARRGGLPRRRHGARQDRAGAGAPLREGAARRGERTAPPGSEAAPRMARPPAASRLGRPAEPPSLVVCPTSVVVNWAREAARFAPALRVHVHQVAGADARSGGAFARPRRRATIWW